MPQVFFPITPVQVVDNSGGNLDWGVVDLSTWLPVGATGAIVYIHSGGGGFAKDWGIRKNGSIDNIRGESSGDFHCWGIIGVDANRRIQFYNVFAIPGKVGCYLIGYTMAGVTMFDNAVAIGPPGLGAWGDIDLSASVPAGAVGVIVQIRAFGVVPTAWGLRQNGSGDNRISNAGNRMNQFCAIIGLDANRVIEGYRADVNTQFWLLGYISAGATFYLNATDMSIVAIGAWETCPNLVPANGLLAFIEVDNGSASTSLRQNVAAGFPPALRNISNHCWGIVPPDGSRQVQALRGGAGVTFSMTGYAHFTPPTVQTLAATGVT